MLKLQVFLVAPPSSGLGGTQNNSSNTSSSYNYSTTNTNANTNLNSTVYSNSNSNFSPIVMPVNSMNLPVAIPVQLAPTPVNNTNASNTTQLPDPNASYLTTSTVNGSSTPLGASMNNSTMMQPAFRLNNFPQTPIYLSSGNFNTTGNVNIMGGKEEIRKMLHITSSDHTLKQIVWEIEDRFQKLYPELQPIEISKVQDSSECDLDPDYVASMVFDQDNKLRVILSKGFTRKSKSQIASLRTLKRHPSISGESGDFVIPKKRTKESSQNALNIWSKPPSSNINASDMDIDADSSINSTSITLPAPQSHPERNITDPRKTLSPRNPSTVIAGSPTRITSGMLTSHPDLSKVQTEEELANNSVIITKSGIATDDNYTSDPESQGSRRGSVVRATPSSQRSHIANDLIDPELTATPSPAATKPTEVPANKDSQKNPSIVTSKSTPTKQTSEINIPKQTVKDVVSSETTKSGKGVELSSKSTDTSIIITDATAKTTTTTSANTVEINKTPATNPLTSVTSSKTTTDKTVVDKSTVNKISSKEVPKEKNDLKTASAKKATPAKTGPAKAENSKSSTNSTESTGSVKTASGNVSKLRNVPKLSVDANGNFTVTPSSTSSVTSAADEKGDDNDVEMEDANGNDPVVIEDDLEMIDNSPEETEEDQKKAEKKTQPLTETSEKSNAKTTLPRKALVQQVRSSLARRKSEDDNHAIRREEIKSDIDPSLIINGNRRRVNPVKTGFVSSLTLSRSQPSPTDSKSKSTADGLPASSSPVSEKPSQSKSAPSSAKSSQKVTANSTSSSNPKSNVAVVSDSDSDSSSGSNGDSDSGSDSDSDSDSAADSDADEEEANSSKRPRIVNTPRSVSKTSETPRNTTLTKKDVNGSLQDVTMGSSPLGTPLKSPNNILPKELTQSTASKSQVATASEVTSANKATDTTTTVKPKATKLSGLAQLAQRGIPEVRESKPAASHLLSSQSKVDTLNKLIKEDKESSSDSDSDSSSGSDSDSDSGSDSDSDSGSDSDSDSDNEDSDDDSDIEDLDSDADSDIPISQKNKSKLPNYLNSQKASNLVSKSKGIKKKKQNSGILQLLSQGKR